MLHYTWIPGAPEQVVPSDPAIVLRREDFWHLSSGGAIPQAGLRKFESGGRAITALPPICFIGSGTLVVLNVMSWCAWPRSVTSSRLSKSSSLMSDTIVQFLGYLFSWWYISWSVLSSCSINEWLDIGYLQYNTQKQMVGSQIFVRRWWLAVFLKASVCALSRCTSWFFFN